MRSIHNYSGYIVAVCIRDFSYIVAVCISFVPYVDAARNIGRDSLYSGGSYGGTLYALCVRRRWLKPAVEADR